MMSKKQIKKVLVKNSTKKKKFKTINFSPRALLLCRFDERVYKRIVALLPTVKKNFHRGAGLTSLIQTKQEK